MNEQADLPNQHSANNLGKEQIPPTAFWECARVGDCPNPTSFVSTDASAAAILWRDRPSALGNAPPDLHSIISAWPRLMPHIREAISTLIDASLHTSEVAP